MKKRYKNQIFNLLKDRIGLEIVEISEFPDIPSLVIKILNTPFEFTIENINGSFEDFQYQYVQFGPKFPFSDIFPPNDEYYVQSANFDSVFNSLTYWLDSHVKEYFEDIKEIDLWEEYKSGNKILNVSKVDFDDKANFSLDERRQIELAINELKFLVQKNFKINEEEEKIVNDRLDYLKDAAERLNRFDWKSVAINTLISISIALSMDTTKGQQLFELFKKVFNVLPRFLNSL